MSVRRLVIEVVPEELNVAAFCRDHGISTWFFWDLRRRHRELGDAVLEPASRAPEHVANKTPAPVEDLIVAMRKELSDLGLDNGPSTIGFHLRQRHEGIPSDSGIWRVLRRRGFITPDPSKRPKTSQRSFSAERANECWQIDDTTWALADGSAVKILNVIDDCSRVVVASIASLTCTTADAFAAFSTAASEWGWPERFLSDNAQAFRHGLASALGELGITAGHSRPYHPQTCGKVERLHQTTKRFLAAQPAAETVEELQAQLDRFRHLYNHHRPHRSLQRRFPADMWRDTPKSGPAAQPVNATRSIHHGTVGATGAITVGRYAINVGTRHRGRHATTIITGTRAHVFADGTLLRQLTLDPTRRVQPLRLP